MANSPQLTPKIETAPQPQAPAPTEKKPAPSPQISRVHRSYGRCEEFRTLVEAYPWDTPTMLAIMRAESGCNPLADNTGLNRDGTVDRGLFQINSIHGYPAQMLFNPAQNIQIAYKIWRSQGYRAWSAYNSGAYLKFL